MTDKEKRDAANWAKQARDILNDPLHESVARQRFIPKVIEVDSIQNVKEPTNNCKLCKDIFKQNNIGTYQVVTINKDYSLKENTHYVCKNCLIKYRIEAK